MRPPAAVVVRDLVGAPRRGDVGLDDHEVGIVIEMHPLDVFVLDGHLDVVGQITGERRQTEWRKQ